MRGTANHDNSRIYSRTGTQFTPHPRTHSTKHIARQRASVTGGVRVFVARERDGGRLPTYINTRHSRLLERSGHSFSLRMKSFVALLLCVFLGGFRRSSAAANLRGKLADPVKELFAAKDLSLVALDPAILSCLTSSKCIEMKVAPILQIGTLFKDVGEFVVVFNKHFGSEKAWSAKMLSTHTVLVKKRLSDSYSRQFGVRLIQQKIEKNYFKVGEEKGIEFVERAFEKFETTEIDDIRVPKDLKTFGIWWKNGRFISCNSDLAKNYTSANAKITSDHIKSLKTFTNMLIAAGQIPSLAFGTLLGWYRNCGVIPYTTDIDISIKVGEFSEEFLQSMKGHAKFKLLRSIGDAEYAREMTVQIPGSGGNSYADVFYRYPVNASFEWTGITYGQDSGWSRLRCVFPTISDLCTGEISGELFFVPCNFLANIQASYGNTDWLEPQDKNYYYTGHDRLVFSDGNWNKNLTDVIRYY